MHYQIAHPNLKVDEWSNIDISNLYNLLKKYSFNEGMFRTSIKFLESNKNLMVFKLGALNIKIDSLAEIEDTIKILKFFLENQKET